MAQFVLVHGAWHGGWCWKHVAGSLENAGHTVHCPDLPGHGNHVLPVPDITLDAYVSSIVELLDSIGEPVTLVGHSMGGMVITGASEARPALVAQAVYLTAVLPLSGESLFDCRSLNLEPGVAEAMQLSEDETSATVAPDQLQPVFYHDCPQADVDYAREHLVVQAIAPMVTPLETSPENFGRVRKAYIECVDDRALAVSYQRALQQRYPDLPVHSLPSSHSPFFSMPEKLASLLERISDT